MTKALFFILLLSASARAEWVVPPVILPFLPDGGYCEHPPLTDDHPGPDEVWSLLQEPASERERREVEVVLDGCPNASRQKIDPWRVLAALRLEETLGVPPRLRFMLPATLCVESGFSEKKDLRGDQGAARGPFQLHWPWTAYCKDRKTWGRTSAEWQAVMADDPRDDLAFSARCQLTAMKRVWPKAAKCGEDRAFEVAEAIVSRAPHPLNCYGRTAHAKLAEKWREAL
ncbi:MAG: hypothetical protein IT477_10805 [Rhodanobacteraceae bacterium]|nr:hypothetical protein [Rhodanobacteraceae bacterium]